MEVKLDRSNGEWFVGKLQDKHNHVLASSDEVPFLWSHRKIKDFQRAEILALGAAGMRNSQKRMREWCLERDGTGFLKRVAIV